MDVVDFVRYFGALALVLALVGGAVLAMRKFGVAGLPGLPGRKARRLSVVETIALGPKHRLVLLRCDTKEHVIVLGPQSATLVGSGAAPEDFSAALAAASGRPI